jgi:diguanylate cyclase (GGDEF)-like protein
MNPTPGRPAEFFRTSRRLLRSRTRDGRAQLYLDLCAGVFGAEAVTVVWRRRRAHLSLSWRGTDATPYREEGPRPGPGYEGVLALESEREGRLPAPGVDDLWHPPGLVRTGPTRLYLPEGAGAGAPRVLVQGITAEANAELSLFLAGIRPHWVERRRLRREASIDHLTRVYNFRHLRRYLSHQCRIQEEGRDFSILMLDLDHLKEYNLRFGHLMGSRVLAQLGRILRTALRSGDFVAKYGGDEFIVILQGAGKKAAVDVALRLRNTISRTAFFGVSPGYITCSFGVATFREDGRDFPGLIRSANQAIFSAKDRGRNTVVVAGITKDRGISGANR